MIKHVSKVALAAAAILALPGLAHAGTGTGTGTSSLTVTSQCSVAGTNVDLGSFTTNDTWGTVFAQNGGWLATGNFVAPSRGLEYANFGSVTCDNGVPYTLTIKGTGSGSTAGYVRLTIAGKTLNMAPFVKKVGATIMADNNAVAGLGTGAWWGSGAVATGNGAAQTVLGTVLGSLSSSPGTLATDKLAAAGTYTDTLTYTLNF